MTFIPHNGYILCKQLTEETQKLIDNGFEYVTEDLPTYEVISISNLSIDLKINVHDVIVINVKPTKLVDDNKNVFYIVNQNNVVASI